MKLRARLALTLVALAVPLVAGAAWLRAELSERAQVKALVDYGRMRMVSGGKEGLLILWDRPTRKELARKQAHDQPFQALAFSPDGKTLASGGAAGKVLLWEVKHLLAPR